MLNTSTISPSYEVLLRDEFGDDWMDFVSDSGNYVLTPQGEILSSIFEYIERVMPDHLLGKWWMHVGAIYANESLSFEISVAEQLGQNSLEHYDYDGRLSIAFDALFYDYVRSTLIEHSAHFVRYDINFKVKKYSSNAIFAPEDCIKAGGRYV